MDRICKVWVIDAAGIDGVSTANGRTTHYQPLSVGWMRERELAAAEKAGRVVRLAGMASHLLPTKAVDIQITETGIDPNDVVDEDPPKRRRAYKRRDMKAET